MSQSLPEDAVPESYRAEFTALAKRLPAYMVLTKRILADPDVPPMSKAFLGAGGVYAISPIDLIPGIIPVAGQLDDAYVLLMGLRQALRSMPEPVADAHLRSAGITRQDIERDIALVIRLAKRIVKGVIAAGVSLGRAGRATYRRASGAIRGFVAKTGSPPESTSAE
jgi:uncharacterized membrane protein YkvA (DUF1232 family)